MKHWLEGSVRSGFSKWIEKYRSSISTDILKSGEYSFKAFLIQVANHDSQDAMPIQFIAYDKLTDEQKHNVERVTMTESDASFPAWCQNQNK